LAAGDPIVSLSDLINLATGGGSGSPEQINFFKTHLRAGAAPGTLVAGRLTDLWEYDGSPSGASTTAPTTSAVVTNATNGAWKQATSASGAKKRLVSVTAVSLVAGSLIIYDRLVQHGGFSGTTTGAQTTNIGTWPALTRFTSGIGVELYAEIYTAVGSPGTTVTSVYTNTTPTGSRTTQSTTFGGTGFLEAQRLIPLPLQIGDKGVTLVTSGTIAASTLTAGNWGLTLLYPLVVLPLPLLGAGRMWSGIMQAGGPLNLGATADSCIAMMWHPSTTTAPQIFGQAFFLEK
jgi:hypothetical protein